MRLIKLLVKRLVLMIQFFTRIPIRLRITSTDEDFGKALVFAPFVGLIIGSIMAIVGYLLLMVLPRQMVAVFVIVMYIVLTGGLHLDGLGDTFDGLFSNRSKERILEIMRDSRVGTNAVLAVVCVLLFNFVALSQVNYDYIMRVIILMPVAGRVGSVLGAAVSVYARKGEGLGKSFIDYCGKKELVWGLLIYFVINLLTFDIKLWIISLILPVTAFIFVKAFARKIGGATGDILGAVCELNQSVFLLLACAIL